MKFLICQIPLQLKSDPFEIVNIQEHIETKKKCIEYAEKKMLRWLFSLNIHIIQQKKVIYSKNQKK